MEIWETYLHCAKCGAPAGEPGLSPFHCSSCGWTRYFNPACAVAAFILVFYTLLVGSKVLLAVALGRARSVLRNRGYSVLMRGLGLLLLAYALGFLCESFRLLTA